MKVRARLFNGKSWITGYYVYLEATNQTWSHRIYTGAAENDDGVFQPEWCLISPATIGRYSDLCDKNDIPIFEGDIVRYINEDYEPLPSGGHECTSLVKFGSYRQDGSDGEYKPTPCLGWYVEVDHFTCPDWAKNDPSFFREWEKTRNLLEIHTRCEVIGNIHDNPGLLNRHNAERT